ncbi:endonuclease [Parazoarcus communis]|uniref:Endonuclease n=1 Tax=Parazoarcus communis TaxID=41977 RepID=A0A2U8H573_9RHOO|nr:endonuclease/exonuclease/phosphatase family protein [Parazoarcus communis]AWI81229.1 endonuclease [Parazoarcus communis]
MRIVSWNIQWGRGADGRVDLDRTIAALREIGDIDVICLQEVGQCFPGLKGATAEDGVAILSAAFPGYEVVFGAALDVPDGKGGRARFGNLLLSRHPLGQVFRHVLPNPADPTVPGMQRLCIEAVIEAPRGPLRVLTTHLEYYSALQRSAQIARLRELHREAVSHARAPGLSKDSNPGFRPWPRPAAAVLCGDLNCSPGSPDHTALLAPIAPDVPQWRDAWQIVNPGLSHAPTVGLHGADWPDETFCCDFICVSDDLAPSVVGFRVASETAASDHQPVVLDLTD